MVKLTEVEDESFQEKPQTIGDEVLLADDDDDYTDTDSEISADDDYDALPSESLSDRLSALQDIIPPKTRGQLSSAASSLYNGTAAALNFSGKALWVISTGVMLVGIPYAWSVLEESQLLEQEREAQMFKEGQGMLNADEKGDGAKASL